MHIPWAARWAAISGPFLYNLLEKPSFTPPDWLFAPVWSAPFAMMAVSGWRVWRHGGFARNRRAMTLFAIQLVLNLAWPLLFFGAHAVGAAFIEMTVLWLAILATMVLFWRHDHWAGILMVPHGAWVAFAGVLNAAIWRLN